MQQHGSALKHASVGNQFRELLRALERAHTAEQRIEKRRDRRAKASGRARPASPSKPKAEEIGSAE